MDVLTEWYGDLLPEELSEAAMLRVDSTQQLTLIESEGERVISLTRSGLPRGCLPREHDREPIEVGDDVAVHRLLEGKQPCLMGEQLADGNCLFAPLGELGPVSGHPCFVIQPATRVGESECHRCQPLRGRVDDDQGVPFPALACLFAANAAPDVDDLLTTAIHATGATQLPASGEVVRKYLANGLEAWTDVPVYGNAVGSRDRHWHLQYTDSEAVAHSSSAVTTR